MHDAANDAPARSTPRTSVGNCGLIRAHCAPLNQDKFLLIFLPQHDTVLSEPKD
jgi:hypothetical protein